MTSHKTEIANTLKEILRQSREKNILVVMFELSADQFGAVSELLVEETDDETGQQVKYFDDCLVVKTDEVSTDEIAALQAQLQDHKGVRYYGTQMSFID